MELRLLSTAALPGTETPPRGLFVSRSGGLIAPPAKGSVSRLADAVFAPGALARLFRAGQAGWRIYLVGNEPAVASGRLSDGAWERFEADLAGRLRAEGIPLAHHYACLESPRGKGKHRKDSVFRFPNTGALYHAAQEDGIELRRSFVISGDADEQVAGWRAGCRVIALPGSAPRDSDMDAEIALAAPDLATALDVLLEVDRRACA